MKCSKIVKLSALVFSLPIFAFAQQQYLQGTEGILDSVGYIIADILVPIFFVLALLVFFWGVVKFIWAEGQGKEDGKKIMIWGIVALFVMSSVWGIVYFIRNELAIDDDDTMPIPTVGAPTN